MTATTLTEAYSRRLLSFHEPSPDTERIFESVEELYNKNHDPKDGRFTSGSGSAGGKVWTGVSAHPDRRVKPKPTDVVFNKATAKRIYDADLGDGYSSHVTKTEARTERDRHTGEIEWDSRKHGTESLYVQGEIRFNGRVRGGFERTIYKNDNGEIVADHILLIIDGHHKGLGVADRFNAHAVAEYQRMGVDHITLTAGDMSLVVGGYAWARQGFRLNGTPGSNRAYLDKQLDRIDTQLLKPVFKPYAAKIRKEVKALKAELEAGEDVQPIHIASIGEKYARHKTTDEDGVPYTTWPGKAVLLGTSWKGVYYFDANRAISAAATDLEHASLRPAFHTEDFYNKNHDPNDGRFTTGGRRAYDDAGIWGNSYQGSSTITGQAADIMGISGYFAGGHPARRDDRFKEPDDVSESRARAVELLGAIHDAIPVKKPTYSGIYIGGERFASLKPGDHIALPTTSITKDAEFAHESGANPYKDYKDGRTPVVLKFAEGTKAVEYQHNYNEMITAGHFEVVSVSKVPSKYEAWKREIRDEPIVDVTEITLRQTHTVDPMQPITAAGEWLTLACHDASCAPPPAGTGGSLQARRGAVAGYGPTARKDIRLGSVRVTYKPDYPDDHPDPGEVVWAKVKYQENTSLSKDRPVLIIGRINGTDKLAAVQLTSQVKGRSDEQVIGPGSWDRLGRNSAVKLSQIIVVDPKDYRREGSVLDRDKFESVIGRLAAHHRTAVTIAAAAHLEEFYNKNHDPKDGRFATGPGGLPKGNTETWAKKKAYLLGLDVLGLPPEVESDIRETARRFRAGIGDEPEVRIRFPFSAVEGIAANGFQSQHDSATSGGLFDPAFRSTVEKRMFSANDTKPIYGYVPTAKEHAQGFITHYGQLSAVLTPEAQERTTVTRGDSLVGGSVRSNGEWDTRHLPAPIKLSEVSKASDERLYLASPEDNSPQRGDGIVNYFETQTHGGVRPQDIAKIIMPYESHKWQGYTPEALQKLFPNAIIEVAPAYTAY